MDDNTKKPDAFDADQQEAHGHVGIIVTIVGAILLLVLVVLFLYLSGKKKAVEPVNLSVTDVPAVEEVNQTEPSAEASNGGVTTPERKTETRPSIVDSMPESARTEPPVASEPPNPSAPPPTSGSTINPAPGGGTPPATTTTPPPAPPPSSGGGGTTPPAQPTPPPAPAPDVTITRLISEEPANASPDQGDINLFQFRVDSTLSHVDFEQVIFALTLGNGNLYGTANSSLQSDPEFHIEKLQPDGSWFRLISTRYSRYSGSLRIFRYLFDFGERLETTATYRIVASDIPCELVGNSLDVSMLDSRGNTNVLMKDPDRNTITDLVYAEQANPVQMTQCSSVQITPRNPVVWLQFEEPSGTLHDSSGFENHTIAQAGLAYQNPRTLTNAIRFVGGASSYVEIPHNQSLAFSDPVTIEAYINPDIDNKWQGLVSKGNGTTQYDYHVAISPNNRLAYYTDFEGVWYEGSSTIPKNDWRHIAVTVGNCGIGDTGIHKGCELKMYVNGAEETVTKFGGGWPNAPDASSMTLGVPSVNPITIGAWSGNAHIYSYAGFMDDLVIYNRVLPQSEIYERYTGTR